MTNELRYTDLFLDFDDTLYDTRGNAEAALEELFEAYELGKYFEKAEDFIRPYWTTNEELWHEYAHGRIAREKLIVERFRHPLSLGKGLNPSEEDCLQMNNAFLELCADKSGVVEGAYALLHHLKRRGYRLHLCSNGFREVQYRKLAAARMTDYFDTIVLSEDAGATKPAAAFFDHAFEATGADREKTLMVGDNFSTDIVGAQGVGMDTLFFNRKPDSFSPPTRPTFEVKALQEIEALL